MKIRDLSPLRHANTPYGSSLVSRTQAELATARLYEGLITSVDRASVIALLKRHFHTLERIHVSDGGDTVALIFRAGVLSSAVFAQIQQHLQRLGWYPAVYFKDRVPSKTPHDYDQLKISSPQAEIAISIEPKYDVEVSITKKRLYHVAPSVYADKILNTGLSPRDGSKLSNHPNRVYLAVDIVSAHEIADALYRHRPVPQTIFTIDTTKLMPGTRFFRDPNFSDGDRLQGVYTLSNIPPAAIAFHSENG